MYDIDIKKMKKERMQLYLFILFVVALMCITTIPTVSDIVTIKRISSKKMATKVEIKQEKNTDGSMGYVQYYYFSVDNKDYACIKNVSSPTSDSNVKLVYYNPKKPTECIVDKNNKNNKRAIKSSINFFILIPVIIISIILFSLHRLNKKIKLVTKLNSTGKLVKNLPYNIIDVNKTGLEIYCKKMEVQHTLPSGITIVLESETITDKTILKGKQKVDLVIDEDNPDNYFIDFEINRLSGNLPEDYYQSIEEINSSINKIE